MKDKVKIYCIIQFLSSFAFGAIIPVYVLYYRHFDLNLFQIALVAAVFEASILIFEMPTGLIADIYGRKISVILSVRWVLSLLISMIFAPFCLATDGIVLTGETTAEVPITIRLWADEASRKERFSASWGMGSPKKTTSGFKTLLHSHLGGISALFSSVSYLFPHHRQERVLELP